MSGADLLPGNEAHVWYIDPDEVTSPALLERCRGLLSDEERARYERFLVERARHEYLVAHALLRRTLSRYAAVPPESWQFSAGPTGKPIIAGPRGAPSFRFNLSHTNGLCACVVSLQREVGIDVEKATRTISAALLESCLAPAEAAQLAGRRDVDFLDFWTLKEAYLKACGLGLRIEPAAVAFRLGPASTAEVLFRVGVADDPARWQFTRLRPGGTHFLAIAVQRRRDESVALAIRRGQVSESGV